MSKYTTQTAMSEIDHIELYINKDKLPLSKIVSQRHPDIAITGNFYSGAWKPVCPLKSDGTVHCVDRQYAYHSLVWNTGPDIHIELLPKGGDNPSRNYITNCVGLVNNETQTMYYGSDVGGRRGRTGWGFRDGKLAFIAFPDGADGMTPEQTRDYVKKLGWSDFILGDGGGKVNFYDRKTGVMLQGKAASQNLILVYLKKTVCLDPGHGVETAGKRSPDGSYLEHEFALDMAKRIKTLLERHRIAVILTREDEHDVSLAKRVQIANAITGLDLFVSIHSNAAGSGSAWMNARGYEVYTSAAGATAGRNIAAKKILTRAKEAGVQVRSMEPKHSNLYVCRNTTAPAVLIEHLFHDNKDDVALLKDPAYRDKLAQADAKGILDFLGVAWEEETPVGQWGDREVAKAVEKGVIQGDEHGVVHADEPMTLRQWCILADRLGLLN